MSAKAVAAAAAVGRCRMPRGDEPRWWRPAAVLAAGAGAAQTDAAAAVAVERGNEPEVLRTAAAGLVQRGLQKGGRQSVEHVTPPQTLAALSFPLMAPHIGHHVMSIREGLQQSKGDSIARFAKCTRQMTQLGDGLNTSTSMIVVCADTGNHTWVGPREWDVGGARCCCLHRSSRRRSRHPRC